MLAANSRFPAVSVYGRETHVRGRGDCDYVRKPLLHGCGAGSDPRRAARNGRAHVGVGVSVREHGDGNDTCHHVYADAHGHVHGDGHVREHEVS